MDRKWKWFDFRSNDYLKFLGWAFMDGAMAVTWVYRLVGDSVWYIGSPPINPMDGPPINSISDRRDATTSKSAKELKALVTAGYRMEGRIMK